MKSLEQIKQDIKDDGRYYNNFEKTQDRKYYLWSVFGNAFLKGGSRYGKPFKITKLYGSNQVILEDKKGNVLYDSEKDKFTPNKFIDFVAQKYSQALNR